MVASQNTPTRLATILEEVRELGPTLRERARGGGGGGR